MRSASRAGIGTVDPHSAAASQKSMISSRSSAICQLQTSGLELIAWLTIRHSSFRLPCRFNSSLLSLLHRSVRVHLHEAHRIPGLLLHTGHDVLVCGNVVGLPRARGLSKSIFRRVRGEEIGEPSNVGVTIRIDVEAFDEPLC